MADKLTTQNAGVRAVALVREILDSYRLPGQPKLSYSGLRGGKTAQNSSRLQDGVVTVNANFRTHSNVGVSFDIPIEIHNGELQEPSVIVHDGLARIIAQSTFDNLVERNTVRDVLPVRELYSSPMPPDIARDAYANRIHMTRVNRGMFSVGANKETLRRAMRGQTVAQLAPVAAPQKAYRVIIDEPEGLCIGFIPEGVEYDEWDVKQDDGVGDVALLDQNDNKLVIRSDPEGWPGIVTDDELAAGLTTLGPDMLIWRSPQEFQAWYAESGYADVYPDDNGIYPGEPDDSFNPTAAPMGTNPNKPPKMPKNLKAPKMPKAPGLKSKPGKSLCSKCNHAPCVCPNKRKKKSALEVVTAEISRLQTMSKTAQGGELSEIKNLIQQLQQKVTQFEKQNPAQKQILDPSGKPAAPSGKQPPPLAPALEKQKQQKSQPAAPATPAAPAGPASPAQGPATNGPATNGPATTGPATPPPGPASPEAGPATPAGEESQGFPAPSEPSAAAAQHQKVMQSVETHPYYEQKYGQFFKGLEEALGKPIKEQYPYISQIQSVLSEMSKDKNSARLYKQVKGPLEKMIKEMQPKKNMMTKVKDMFRPDEPAPGTMPTQQWTPGGLQNRQPGFKASSVDLVSKVSREVEDLRNDGVSDIDIKQAVFTKYGPEIAASIFKTA